MDRLREAAKVEGAAGVDRRRARCVEGAGIAGKQRAAIDSRGAGKSAHTGQCPGAGAGFLERGEALVLPRSAHSRDIETGRGGAAWRQDVVGPAARHDDIAGDGRAGLQLQPVVAARKDRWRRPDRCLSHAGNGPGIDDAQSGTDDADAADTLQRCIRHETGRAAAAVAARCFVQTKGSAASAIATADAAGIGHGAAGRQGQSRASTADAASCSTRNGHAGGDGDSCYGIGRDAAAPGASG